MRCIECKKELIDSGTMDINTLYSKYCKYCGIEYSAIKLDEEEIEDMEKNISANKKVRK